MTMDISDIIGAFIDEHPLLTPYSINGGMCEEFALFVADRVAGAVMIDSEQLNDLNLYGHVWILYDGRYYDSETPLGVSDPYDLPFFRRMYPVSRPAPVPYGDDVQEV